MCLTGRPGHRDAGYTVIELLIVIVVLGVITVPLANSIIVFVRNSDAISGRLTLSHDAQLSAAYFAGDVASVGVRDHTRATGTIPFKPSIQTDATFDAGGVTCGTAAIPPAVVRLLADDWRTSGTEPVMSTDVVSYYLKPMGPTAELRRMKCAGTTTPLADIAVAHNVDPATVTLTCSSTCTAASVPDRVTLAFTVRYGSADPYRVTLTGQRRQT